MIPPQRWKAQQPLPALVAFGVVSEVGGRLGVGGDGLTS